MRVLWYVKQTQYAVPLFAVLFFLLITLIPGGASEFQGAATVAAGIFGIYIGFTINSSRAKLNGINELLKTENARNLLTYRLSSAFGEKVQDDIRNLLDKYLIDQIDYRLEDFDLSGSSLHELHSYVTNIKAKTSKEKEALSSISSTINQQWIDRAQIETLVIQRLSRMEWLSIIGLAGGFILSLWPLSNGDLLLSLMLTVIASSVLLLIFVLRDLDQLKWQKSKWTWLPLHKLFLHLDLTPYYPAGVIKNGEARVKRGEEIRVARYYSPYPNMVDKTIEIVEYGQNI